LRLCFSFQESHTAPLFFKWRVLGVQQCKLLLPPYIFSISALFFALFCLNHLLFNRFILTIGVKRGNM